MVTGRTMVVSELFTEIMGRSGKPPPSGLGNSGKTKSPGYVLSPETRGVLVPRHLMAVPLGTHC